ncbi:MAG: hypothetical protein V2J25_06970 [Desulfatiglans sp.]|jgi:hypothetical protein|nr:hypothetical protein [Thermodesulfobacteriota bacterium]MEE4352599.1 hypothetical protein [Desulfatiglans sp.]
MSLILYLNAVLQGFKAFWSGSLLQVLRDSWDERGGSRDAIMRTNGIPIIVDTAAQPLIQDFLDE